MVRKNWSISIGIALAAIGLGLVVIATMFKTPSKAIEKSFSLVNAIPTHAVTPQMFHKTSSETGYVVPNLNLICTSGHKLNLYESLKAEPVFLVFILDSCPCSAEGQPFYNRLYRAFGTKIQFIGITNGDLAQAKEWQTEMHMKYPIVSDPDIKLMHFFHAQHSAYSLVILPDHHIGKMWPGFSQKLLTNIASTLTQVGGASNHALDFSDAPLRNTSGCFFYGEAESIAGSTKS